MPTTDLWPISDESNRKESGVKNPLDSLWGTIICGVVLTVILYYVAEWIVRGHAAGVGA